MKVGIIGAGAMGCLLGSFLTKEIRETWLVDIWEEHVNQINEKGLSVVIGEKTETVTIKATINAEAVGICDLIIISTKFHNTHDAIRDALTMINDETVVVTLQNGIGNVEIISQFVNKEKIVYGVTTLGSVLKGPGIIEATVTDEGETYLWPLIGKPNKKLKDLIDVFNRAGLNFILSSDVEERIWKKLCLNAGLSIPLAILRLNCGDYIKQPHSLKLTRSLVFEIVSVAVKEGVGLDAELMYENVVNLARRSPNHRTSALLDVLNHRKTEIDAINGALIKKAEQYGIEIPYNLAIYNVIKIIENTYQRSIKSASG